MLTVKCAPTTGLPSLSFPERKTEVDLPPCNPAPVTHSAVLREHSMVDNLDNFSQTQLAKDRSLLTSHLLRQWSLVKPKAQGLLVPPKPPLWSIRGPLLPQHNSGHYDWTPQQWDSLGVLSPYLKAVQASDNKPLSGL